MDACAAALFAVLVETTPAALVRITEFLTAKSVGSGEANTQA